MEAIEYLRKVCPVGGCVYTVQLGTTRAGKNRFKFLAVDGGEARCISSSVAIALDLKLAADGSIIVYASGGDVVSALSLKLYPGEPKPWMALRHSVL